MSDAPTLQDQGLLPNGDGTLGYNVADAQQRSNTQAIRVNVLNESLREVTSSRVAISALVLVNVPQVRMCILNILKTFMFTFNELHLPQSVLLFSM